jgi:hypothetical protein
MVVFYHLLICPWISVENIILTLTNLFISFFLQILQGKFWNPRYIQIVICSSVLFWFVCNFLKKASALWLPYGPALKGLSKSFTDFLMFYLYSWFLMQQPLKESQFGEVLVYHSHVHSVVRFLPARLILIYTWGLIQGNAPLNVDFVTRLFQAMAIYKFIWGSIQERSLLNVGFVGSALPAMTGGKCISSGFTWRERKINSHKLGSHDGNGQSTVINWRVCQFIKWRACPS